MSGALVEREAETRALTEALAGVRSGGGSVVVAGPAGIGKTTLVDHAVDDARRLGFQVLTARSRPISREASFGLLRDWFDLPARRVAAGDPPYDGPAEVLRRLPEAPAVTDVGYGLRWVLDALSREAPVLLVADDLHWTDEASLQSLDLLVAALPSMPVLLLGAVRTGEEPAGGDVLDRIVAESLVVRPEPLSVEGVSAVLADSPREGLVAGDLHRVTGGVPFLLQAQVRVDLGGVLVPSDPARALGLLRAAEEYAVAESVGPLRERIEPLLYRLGEVPSTTDNLLARLTPGELTVARLVAEGLSNREIGQRLFVTRKTVEFHLSSIYRKLGTSSRRQLTAVVGGARPGERRGLEAPR